MKEIILTQGKVALVDDSDYEYLNQWRWNARKGNNTYYAARKIKKPNGHDTSLIMHRVILGIVDSELHGDHKDHNGLNNQRYNLRVVTHSQNMQNRLPNRNSFSRYKGVFFRTENKKWVAQIRVIGGNKKHLGQFENEIDAALAYNNAARNLYGQYACLNEVV